MLQELNELVDEVRLSFHALSEFARHAHGDRIEPAGRAVLEYLSRNPPSAVPAIARARGVSRQHIQTLVSGLESDDLVEARPNPAHKRSPLFALTADGRSLMGTIADTEAGLIAPFMASLDAARLAEATDTLAGLRRILTELEHTP
ncbi:MAG: hypothetical protein DHS20C19_23790 [Acidimicrobiales bacterium]|nr:MAG: hypothetical protein DHS20C19_23790 [Acidimicrobiales bacterium]